MPIRCPDCRSPRMEPMCRIELPPDGASDEVMLAMHRCPDCGATGVEVYEESRRGALDSESWRQRGFRLQPAHNDLLGSLIRTCPDPSSRRCGCAAHRILAREGKDGRWDGLALNGMAPVATFDVETTGER